MNGIVVMDCVQTAYQGKYDIYGKRDRLIRITGRRAAAVNGSGSYYHESFADCKDSPQHGYNPETSSLKKTTSKKAGSKRFVTKKTVEMAAGSKNKDIENRKPVKASEKAKSIAGQKEIRTGVVSSVRKEKKSSSALRALRLLLLAAALTSMITGFHMITGASGRPRQQAWKYHTTVSIPYGESFEDLIERTFNSTYYSSQEDYLKEICQINSLPFHRGEIPQLQSGTSLVIPYYSTEYK